MRTSNVLAPAAKRMSVADRIIAEYAPSGLWVAEAPDVYGQASLIGWRDHARGGRDCNNVSGTAPTFAASDANFGNKPTVTCSGGYVYTTATFADGDLCLLVVFRDPSVTGSWEGPVGFNYADNISWFRDNATDANEWTIGVIEPAPPYGQVVTGADGLTHAIFLRRVATTHDVWVDGKQRATKAGSGTTTTATTMKIGFAPSGANFGGTVAMVAKWNNTAPSDAGLQEMTRWLRAEYVIGEEP